MRSVYDLTDLCYVAHGSFIRVFGFKSGCQDRLMSPIPGRPHRVDGDGNVILIPKGKGRVDHSGCGAPILHI